MFPLTELFYRTDSTDFIVKLVETILTGRHKTVIYNRVGNANLLVKILMTPYGKGKKEHFNQYFHEIKTILKNKLIKFITDRKTVFFFFAM